MALVVSLGLAVLRFYEWWNARHRVFVVARSMTVGAPSGDDDARTANHSHVAVTVTTQGAPVAISRVGFELVSSAPVSTQGPTLGTVRVPLRLLGADFPPTGFGDPVNLASGTAKTWVTTLDVPPYDYTTMRGYVFRATVELTNGKTHRSEPFWHAPTPPEGWFVDDSSARDATEHPGDGAAS